MTANGEPRNHTQIEFLGWCSMNRQAMFKLDGTITDVPSDLTEQAPEVQLDLLACAEDQAKLEKLRKETEK